MCTVEFSESEAMLMTGTATWGRELEETVMAGVDMPSMLTSFSPGEIENAML